jgi:SAP domain-containing protein
VWFYSATLTVKQLKELCRKHGLKVTGTKATLILQLENADKKAQETGDAR